MKITNDLVQTFNARLQDLHFELQTIGMLEAIEDNLASIEIFTSMTPETVLSEGDDRELFQMRMLKTIMRDMKVSDANGVIQMIATRAGVVLNDMDDVKDLYQKVENDIKNILQTDLVMQYLEGLGLSESARIEIDFVKTGKLEELAKVLAIKNEEIK
jgi:hypothetical protein